MKKIFFNVTACICAGLLFAGCNKEGDDDVAEGGSSAFDGVIKVTNVVNAPSNSQVDVVKACVRFRDDDGEFRNYEITSAPYKDGSFTLNLPIVPDQYLAYVGDIIEFSEAIISDRNAKYALMVEDGTFVAFKDGNRVGEFGYGYSSEGESVAVVYWYVDRNVSITGTETTTRGTTKFELFLKKGWNIVWIIEHDTADTSNDRFTTSTGPSSLLKWHYWDHSSYNVNQARTAKSTGKHKAFSIGGIVESELMGVKK